MHATTTTQAKALQFACNAALFSVVGPPIGALSVLAVIFAVHPSASSTDLIAIPMFAIFGMSYVFGLVPALITGVLVSWRGTERSVSCLFVLASATLAIVGPMIGYATITPLFGSSLSLHMHLLMLAGLGIGAYPAALICLMTARKLSWLPNKNP